MKRYQLFEFKVKFLRSRHIPDPRCPMDSIYAGKEHAEKTVRIVAQDERLAVAQAIVSFGPGAEPEILDTQTSKIDYVVNVDN